MGGMQHQYRLRPSRQLMWLILFLLLSLVLVLFQLPLATEVAIPLYVGASLWAAWIIQHKAMLQSVRACVAFRLEPENGIVLVLKNGQHIQGSLQAGSLVTPAAVMLNVQTQGALLPTQVIILEDAMRHEDFRRLRQRLRWA